MDEGKSSYSFNRSNVIEPVNKSIMESRALRKSDASELTLDLKQLKSETESVIASYKKLPKLTGEQGKRLNELLITAQALKKTISEATNGQADYSKAIELANKSAKELIKNKKQIYFEDMRSAKTEQERSELAAQLNIESERYGEILEKNAVRAERNKKANESLFDSFHNGIKSMKNDLAQIATVTGLDSIYNSLTGNGGQLQTYNNMRSQFNMTKSDFNQFKRDVLTQVKENGNLFKYGFQDALDYMNRLGELGITDQQMAKEQMDAIMLSTKYLGLSADTQTKILRQARNTGNMDLLNQTNRTMVQIMNAQLGVSKDQLDAIVNQSTELADLATMFSGNPNALKSFTMSASAIESVYGESASKAAMDIAADLLNNAGSSKYIGVLGENYGTILKGLQAGDGRALYDILRAVQSSNVSGTGAGGAEAWSSLKNNGGYLDTNTLALYNARSNGNDTYGTALEKIASSSDDTEKYLEDMQLDFRTMLTNFTSWVNAFIPLQTLQTAYYGLAMADLVLGGTKAAFSILKTLKLDIVPLLAGGKARSDEVSKLLGGNGGTGITAYLGNIVAGLSIIAGAVWAVKDGIDGSNKAEEWGVSKGSAFMGGLLGGTDDDPMVRTIKNSLKYGLIGAGLGFFIGGGIPGAIAGGLIGLAAGGITGMIGGKSFAQGFDSLGVGMESSAPVTNLSHAKGSYSGKGGILPSSDFPWSITSPFGYRGTIQTKAGNTDPFHNGIDLAHPDGTPIGANNSGIVSASGTASDGANYVIINSGDGYEQVYWHLNQPSHLKAGQSVNAGQLIGYMGMTGMATGPHLHFGLRHAGTRDYIDPINSINSELFYPNENGVSNMGVWLPGMALEDDKPSSTTILKRLIDADTQSKEVQALAYDGVGSTSIVDSVNGGFSNLIQKIDDLNNRQNKQEEMLKILASSRGTNIYKY